jgi:hypothetical protein
VLLSEIDHDVEWFFSVILLPSKFVGDATSKMAGLRWSPLLVDRIDKMFLQDTKEITHIVRTSQNKKQRPVLLLPHFPQHTLRTVVIQTKIKELFHNLFSRGILLDTSLRIEAHHVGR